MNRKITYSKVAGFLIVVVLSSLIGFISGNSYASRGDTISKLYSSVSLLELLEEGKTERAEDMCKLFITGDYAYLNTKPFWIESLNGRLHFNPDRLYSEVAQKAADIHNASVKNLPSIDARYKKAFEKAFGPDCKSSDSFVR